jgi:hypothetical protein
MAEAELPAYTDGVDGGGCGGYGAGDVTLWSY